MWLVEAFNFALWKCSVVFNVAKINKTGEKLTLDHLSLLNNVEEKGVL